ncbi:Hypothetical Protein FCC1311_013822 [Hondaea fermentalgiana]|uniref:Uncharacterized protein n=1 Tax=Hondaea fermentalgiana TaxID=2315210 RepID=A0A2R5G3Q6_9STRA|nr:Hypothetical Protein FCC1311_013822 [Hondaea fermentalgiana]|eukprot:GBG25165.1 Hypothetical Protein FCC1311_013822 [Hondaea fermentalgiana]
MGLSRDAFPIITRREGAVRMAIGVALLVAAVYGYWLPEPGKLPFEMSYGRAVTFTLTGTVFFSTGKNQECIMIIRGLYNLDGRGYRYIPEEYKEFADAKRVGLLRHLFTVFSSVTCLVLLLTFLAGALDLQHILEVISSIAWILAIMFTNLYTKSTIKGQLEAAS